MRAPFPSADIEWRVGRVFTGGEKGSILSYITARGIQDRLDDVFGVDGWDVDFQVQKDVGVLCTLTCRYDTKVFKKCDGASFTPFEPLKGGISSALKRAAVQLGIGRYLYDLPEVVVPLHNKKFYGKVILPDKFLPESERIGNDELKVESKKYASNHQKTNVNKEMTPEVERAMEFVVRNDKYNEGKKMGEVWNNSLKFLAKGRDEEQAKAARIVAEYKGIEI